MQEEVIRPAAKICCLSHAIVISHHGRKPSPGGMIILRQDLASFRTQELHHRFRMIRLPGAAFIDITSEADLPRYGYMAVGRANDLRQRMRCFIRPDLHVLICKGRFKRHQDMSALLRILRQYIQKLLTGRIERRYNDQRIVSDLLSRILREQKIAFQVHPIELPVQSHQHIVVAKAVRITGYAVVDGKPLQSLQ